MGRLIIDDKKCKKDGICVGECPVVIIQLKDGDGLPELVPGNEQNCLECGHCVAVCPHGALSHDQIPVEDCPAIDKERVINQQQATQFLRSRRSIRSRDVMDGRPFTGTARNFREFLLSPMRKKQSSPGDHGRG